MGKRFRSLQVVHLLGDNFIHATAPGMLPTTSLEWLLDAVCGPTCRLRFEVVPAQL